MRIKKPRQKRRCHLRIAGDGSDSNGCSVVNGFTQKNYALVDCFVNNAAMGNSRVDHCFTIYSGLSISVAAAMRRRRATRWQQRVNNHDNTWLYTFSRRAYSRLMPTEYDATEFVDTDFHNPKAAYPPPASSPTGGNFRAPTREEVDSRVSEAQRKLAELKRAQEELERERAALEEVRRRQTEFQTGRQEMIQNLTRGLGLLEEAEFAARRDAEQMSKTVAELRDALAKVQAINEEVWSKEQFNVELTRALTTLENARMEWNSARLKFGVLSGETSASNLNSTGRAAGGKPDLAALGFGELCKLGLAFTWPLAVVALLGLGVLVAILLRPH